MPQLSKRHEKSSEAYRPSDRYASLLFKEAGPFHAGPASMRINKKPDKPKRPADRSGVRICLAWSGVRDLNPRSLGPKPSAIPNFAKPGWIRFWRRGFGRCGESTGYYIRFAWKMQPPFFGRRGCFTDGAVVFSDGMVVFFSAGKRSPPSPSPRGEGVAAGDGRGVVSDRSFFRRMQKRNE